MEYTDYDSVAEIYDLYASATCDYEFFSSRISTGMRVLEPASGTGRLSISLLEAGAKPICVDLSPGMPKVLRRKLSNRGLEAEVHCADVQHLEFEDEFEPIDRDAFRQLATDAGFAVKTLFEDYAGGAFDGGSSLAMIRELGKRRH